MGKVGFITLIAATAMAAGRVQLNIHAFTLDNGLKVLVVEDHSVPLVSTQVWVRAGSRNERQGITGISHLLEHMMFKGTQKRKSEEYSLVIQSLGGTDNAFTAEDKTAYYSVLPSSKAEVAFDLESDRFQNAVFREFESEKNVVMEERRWRTENDPWGLLFEHLEAIAFIAHPYHNPIIGWMSDLENITLEDVKNYYRTYYVPNNLVLVVSGDITPERARELAEKYFGPIPRGPAPPPVRTQEPPQRGERRVTVEKEGFLNAVAIAWHIPPFSHPDYPALEILATILGNGKSSRLYRKLVQEQGIATAVGAFSDARVDPSLFYIYGALSQGKTLEELETGILQEVERLQKEPVNSEELQKAYNKAASAFVFRQQSVAGKGFMVGNFEILESWEVVNTYLDRLKAVTAEDVMRVAQTYLTPDNRTVAHLVAVPPANPEEYFKKMQEGAKKEFRR